MVLATAQLAVADETNRIDPQPMNTALQEFAERFSVQVIYQAEVAKGLTSHGADASLPPAEVLDQLLQNTNLQYEFLNDRTLMVKPAKTGEQLQRLSQVNYPRPRLALLQADGVQIAESVTAPAAASASTAPKNEPAVEEITVTGSRIKRTIEASPAMVTSLNAEDIAMSGAVNITEVLRESPAVGFSNFRSNEAFDFDNSGLNSINLRSLGESRTLVLVDGRRRVSSIPGQSVVDFNSIPSDFIERIEILTGGASAIYGSDAIAGVLNVILKDDFEGLMVSGQYGDSEAGGGASQRISATLGGNVLDGRGNAMFNVEYANSDPLYTRQRKWAAVDSFYNPATDRLTIPFYSSGGPGGRFYGNRFGIDRNGNVYSPFNATADGYNRASETIAEIPIERFSFNAKMKYDLTDTTRLFVDGGYVNVRTDSDVGTQYSWTTGVYRNQEVDENGRLLYFGIPLTNPLIPAQIRQYGLDNGYHVVDFVRRATDQDNITIHNERQTISVAFGAEGKIAERWDWNTYYSFGRSTQSMTNPGMQNAINMRYALDAIVDPNNPGNVICRDPNARAEGCVPLDIFGYDRVSPEAADYVAYTRTKEGSVEQQVVSASVSGALFQLPAGPVQGVFGAEHRREQSSVTYDGLTNAGQTTATADRQLNSTGQFDVSEAFIEASAPLLSNRPFAKYLSVDAAVRVADYSTIGSTLAWKGGIEWMPADSVRFRGVYSVATRAPNITELFAPREGISGFATGVKDPCDGVTAASTGTLANNCRVDPGIARAIAENGVFEYTQTTVQFFGSSREGNPNLKEEEARTLTLGLTYQPQWANSLRLSVDYFDITIKDAISSLNAQAIVDNCMNSPSFPRQANCMQIERLFSGHINNVNQLLVNQAEINTAGIDTGATYRWNMLDTFEHAGALTFRLQHSYLLKLESRDFPGSPVIDARGQLGGSMLKAGIKHRAVASVSYAYGPFTANWNTTYYGKVLDRLNPPQDYSLNHVDAQIYHDLQLRLAFGTDASYETYAGVKNLFDNKPPLLPSGTFSGRATIGTAPIYDILGRYYYIGATARF